MKKFGKLFSRKTKQFHSKRKGMEVLQVAIIILIACGLIGVIVAMSGTINDKMNGAKDAVENLGDIGGFGK